MSPYVYKGKIIEILGQPHSFHGDVAGYRFANALLQVNYENDAVVSVALVATRKWWPNRFRVFPFGWEIGSTSFAEVCEIGSNGTLRLRAENSSKFYTRWSQQYLGFPGRYLTYGFGMIEAATFPAPQMPKGEVEFGEWDEASDIRYDTLLTPKTTRFNAVMISTAEVEFFPFTWSIFS
ncbi:hypothetical protein ACNHE5_14590 [Pandoraea pnomenusa]|uniref:hypothetical protein n=1 Tax=Pandoraea pnomenusa TaxID=93220 RepID=UPI003CF57F7C